MSTAYTLANLVLLPDSPRWLVLHGRLSEADRIWEYLGIKREDRDAMGGGGLVDEQATLTEALEEPFGQTGKKHASLADLWAVEVRKRTFLAVFLMGFLQLCGIDAVLYVRSSLSPLAHHILTLIVRPCAVSASRTPNPEGLLFSKCHVLTACQQLTTVSLGIWCISHRNSRDIHSRHTVGG